MQNNINKKAIAFNAFTTVLQVVFTGVVYFFLYKTLINKLGAPLLGVWSIVLVTVSLANLGNFGITSGLVKFIAEYTSLEERQDLKRLIFTALISTIILYSLFSFIIWLLSSFILNKVIDKEFITIAKCLIPYSLFSLFVNGCNSVFFSILDGFEKNYIKNIIIIIGNLILISATFFWIDKKGIFSVAIAQNIQVVFILVCSFFYSFFLVKANFLAKWNWDSKMFKKISVFGIKFQFISISQMLYEPITKVLLGKYSSLAVVGYYEMASRLVAQIRGVVSNANQVIVPIVSKLQKRNSNEELYVYTKTLALVFLAGILAFSGIIFFSISISNMWIGEYNAVFIKSLFILSIANLINLLCGPAYFSLLGKAQLNSILIIHILIGVTNFLLGFLLGKIIPNYGVIISWGISLSLGSIVLIYLYQKTNKIYFFESISKRNTLILSILFVITLFHCVFSQSTSNMFSKNMLIIISALSYLTFSMICIYSNSTLIKSVLKISKAKQ